MIRFVLLAGIATMGCFAQGSESVPRASTAPARSQYFSGFVTELSSSVLAVTRKGPGKDTLRRTFILDPQTKVEGKMHLNARVTVRYETRAEGDHAIRVIVR